MAPERSDFVDTFRRTVEQFAALNSAERRAERIAFALDRPATAGWCVLFGGIADILDGRIAQDLRESIRALGLDATQATSSAASACTEKSGTSTTSARTGT